MQNCKLCHKKFKDYQKKGRSRCGSCNTKIRRFRTKYAAIKLLGGKCQRCGWHGNQAALQFHHKNPDVKEFIIGSVANKSWDSIKTEMQKCILLCANCHMIEHSSKNEEEFLKEALNYKGRTLIF
jgi:protein-arginine kinase activator protein McsA